MIIRSEHDLQQALLLDSETEHVEFKEAKNRYDFEELVGYCCALANEGGGSIVLGVTDKLPRRIVGTAAFDAPDRTKIGLFDRLHLRVELIEIMTAEGRVLSFVVPPRPPGRPVNFTRLLAHLATIVRNVVRPKSARPGEATFTLTTRPNPKQQQALDLIAAITV